jgi:hypothetical protein
MAAGLAAVLGAASGKASSGDIPIRINGMGWIQAGRIMHASDTIGFNYNGNWFQNVRGQVTALAEISPTWEGSLGIGIRQFQKGITGQNVAQGSPSSSARLTVGVEPYIAQARFTYYRGGDHEEAPWQATFGYFPYQYNENVRNLGLYLLRGTVYPGYVFSGFETDETIGIASQLGANLRARTGPVTHDLLLTSETRIRPLFDYSLAYIGKFRAGSAVELGAGVNLYRLLPINPGLTTPRDPEVFLEDPGLPDTVASPLDRRHFEVSPGSADTTRFTLAGTKADVFGSLDLKRVVGRGNMGEADLKLYFEAAIIGIRDYGRIYGDIRQRIPVMVGFNLPAFDFLDHLSLEVEWYGTPYRNDYQKLENYYSPIPVSNQGIGRKAALDSAGNPVLQYSGRNFPKADPYDVEHRHRDDFKWSLHGARTFKGHVRISGQIANDHFRTGGTYFSDGYETAFSTLKDWYFMAKLTCFF